MTNEIIELLEQSEYGIIAINEPNIFLDVCLPAEGCASDVAIWYDDNKKCKAISIYKVDYLSISENNHSLWKGFVDDYNSVFPPYGHQKVEYLTVMNGTDLLKLYVNISPFSAKEQIEIENIKKYFHFCTFPDNGAERLYRRYGKKTEEYVQKHSLEDLDALIAETREVE